MNNVKINQNFSKKMINKNHRKIRKIIKINKSNNKNKKHKKHNLKKIKIISKNNRIKIRMVPI